MSDSQSTVPAITGAAPSRRLELDNLIRRELRVGDPGDPKQVAQALMQRYGETPQARSLVNEAKGMPFLQTVTLAPAPVAAPTATSLDLKQAKDDIEADMRELLTSNQLKDVTPELEGWAQSIRAAVADGEQSAALGIDTRQRDRTFAVRRQLSDYARAARLVGALNPRSNDEFRSLAQSLDEAAAVLLVMMGESLANTGIAGGRYLMQVPFGELQTRREAVLHALRNLNGSSQYAWGPNDWPRGVDAYRQLFHLLERQGQGELRSLLTENGMVRVMDQLIDRAGQGISGLRALGVTALLELQQFQRLIAAIHWGLEDVDSPPLVSLQEALQLFVDGFRPTGGIRLIGIARPQILNYGLYGNRSLSEPEVRLEGLLRLRGNLATQSDCYAGCVCDTATAALQVLFDQALYDLDRAIDLYAAGAGSLEAEPEVRAATYGFVMDAIGQRARALGTPGGAEIPDLLADSDIGARVLLVNPLQQQLNQQSARDLMLQELQLLKQQESHQRDMAGQLGDGCGLLEDLYREAATEDKAVGDIPLVLASARSALVGQSGASDPPPVKISLPRPLEISNDLQVTALLRPKADQLETQVKTLSDTLAKETQKQAAHQQAEQLAREAYLKAVEEFNSSVQEALQKKGPIAKDADVDRAVHAMLRTREQLEKALADTRSDEQAIGLKQKELDKVQSDYARLFDFRTLGRPQLLMRSPGLATTTIKPIKFVVSGLTAGNVTPTQP